MPTYVIHPGSVQLLRKPYNTVYIDAGTLAAYYDLDPSEYTTGIDETTDKGQHIHLYPRPDGKYRKIESLNGQEDGSTFYSKSAQVMKRDRLRGKDYYASNGYYP